MKTKRSKKTATYIEAIEWWDHSGFTENRWRSKETAGELVPCRILTVGVLLREDKDVVILASTVDFNNENYEGIMCILKPLIETRKRIKC